MQEAEPSRPSLQLGHASLESGSLMCPTHETPHLCLRHKGSDLCLPCSLSLEVTCCSQQLGEDVLSLASPAFIPIYPWHVVEGTLRKLVNNQRKISQASVSPFPLLITLSLMNCIFLTYHFLCSCPLQSYSQF